MKHIYLLTLLCFLIVLFLIKKYKYHENFFYQIQEDTDKLRYFILENLINDNITNIENLDVQNYKDMSGLFYFDYQDRLTKNFPNKDAFKKYKEENSSDITEELVRLKYQNFNGNITQWNTKNLENIKQMFKDSKKFDRDITKWTFNYKNKEENIYEVFKNATAWNNKYEKKSYFGGDSDCMVKIYTEIPPDLKAGVTIPTTISDFYFANSVSGGLLKCWIIKDDYVPPITTPITTTKSNNENEQKPFKEMKRIDNPKPKVIDRNVKPIISNSDFDTNSMISYLKIKNKCKLCDFDSGEEEPIDYINTETDPTLATTNIVTTSSTVPTSTIPTSTIPTSTVSESSNNGIPLVDDNNLNNDPDQFNNNLESNVNIDKDDENIPIDDAIKNIIDILRCALPSELQDYREILKNNMYNLVREFENETMFQLSENLKASYEVISLHNYEKLAYIPRNSNTDIYYNLLNVKLFHYTSEQLSNIKGLFNNLAHSVPITKTQNLVKFTRKLIDYILFNLLDKSKSYKFSLEDKKSGSLFANSDINEFMTKIIRPKNINIPLIPPKCISKNKKNPKPVVQSSNLISNGGYDFKKI